ncbi:hypothetical protein ACFWDI_01065 [Streptomyces sp. NPDC060064]|uniref:hypothetical protein n=1 Tax=Streptomyces sp. NPDC060064 TaxID=3347049 RepID=UPI00368BB9FF
MFMLEWCIKSDCTGLNYSLVVAWWAFWVSAASGTVAAFSPQRPNWSRRWRPLLARVHLTSLTTSVVGILVWGN